jgi:TolB-like protein
MKRFCFPVMLFLVSALGIFAQALSLEDAVTATGRSIEQSLGRGSKVAVLNFTTPSENFSAYLAEEVTGVLVNGKKLVLVDRRNFEEIQKEMDFQLSGEVSDESAQAIGKKLGAEYLISGAFIDTGLAYRFRVQAVNVTTAAIETAASAEVLKDSRTDFLFAGSPQRPAPGRQPSVPEGGVYKTGDYGPAGGIVFYDKGVVSGGWRYLEAAPAETEKVCAWGKSGAVTSTAVGGGKRNTQTVIRALESQELSDQAAQVCAGLDFGGFKDWFLPSIDELNLIYQNLKKNDLGSFDAPEYWSSSGLGGDNALTYVFSGANPGRKQSVGAAKAAVRAVRAF